MADLPLYDNPDDIPVPRPREDMRFEDVQVKPYADGRRVKLIFKLTPFLDRPSVDAWVTNAQGETVTTMSLIEAMDQAFDFTLHLRGPEPGGEHTLHLILFYIADDDHPDERQVVDERSLNFSVQSSK
jgi:hypothetical protein